MLRISVLAALVILASSIAMAKFSKTAPSDNFYQFTGAVDTNCSADPCTITTQIPSGAITSITGYGGDYLMNIPSGRCSATPICKFDSQNGSVNLFCASWRHHASSSATALKFYCVDAAAVLAAGRVSWDCKCAK